ncbi:MAG: helix-turn-helix transcriptional regulator [Candidatus Omnitrophica bacterium]|nr:helix-turn-helix transcriptional regulator [Candidatus Omnitrophota bacterium]
MKEYTFRDHLQKLLKDPYFKELYELDQQKLEVVKKIIAYRIEHKMSQRQLAKQIGITQQHISKIENGEFSSMSTLQKVLLGIGFSVSIQAVPLTSKVINRSNKERNLPIADIYKHNANIRVPGWKRDIKRVVLKKGSFFVE